MGLLINLLLTYLTFNSPKSVSSQYTVPQFTNLPKDKTTVKLYGRLLLQCSATGNPTPKVINWLRDETPVNFNINFLSPSGEMKITRVQKSDAGKYQCVAKNSYGGVASKKREVIVAYFERIYSPPIDRISKKVNSYFHSTVPAYDCEPKPLFVWKKNNVVIEENERIKIGKDGDLFISNVKSLDIGTYVLTLENTFLKNKGVRYAQQTAKTVEFNILGEERNNNGEIIFVSRKEVVAEDVTATVTLECFINKPSTDKIVNIVWYKVNEFGKSSRIPESSKYTRTDGGQRLVIKSPTYKADHGKFKCTIFYQLNVERERELALDVFSVPEFMVRPLDKVAYTDNETSLHCTSEGFPGSQQGWYRNGIPVIPDKRMDILENNTLVLKKLNWEDQGVYQCTASNPLNIVYYQAHVQVKNISAKIENDFRNVYVGTDANVQVPCIATGAPKPEVYWLVNSTRITLPHSQYSVLENGTLVINKLDWETNGLYTCVADNRIGIARKSTHVFVIIETEFTETPKRETYARTGQNVRLPCTVRHDPNINYTREWRRKNLPVKDKRYVVQTDGALLITHAQDIDTGIDFSCHIFSHGGNLTVFTSLVLAKLPLRPSAPRVVDVQAYSLLLEWDAPSDGNSPLVGYYLYMRNYTQRSYIQFKVDNPTHRINNLRAGAKYQFKVAALNKFGKGDDSALTKWIETQMLAPSKSPNGFKSIKAVKDTATLEWEIPPKNTHNGELLGFYIGYRLAGYNMGFTSIDVKGALTTSHTIYRLPLFTKYEVKIAAYNNAGTGPWSDTQTIETQQGVPSVAPTNVSVSIINETCVSVSFNSPPQEQWNGQLVQIISKTWPPNRPQDSTNHYADYDPSSLHKQTFFINNLLPNTEYTLAVSVATTGGPSPGSEAVQFKTQEGIPDAVRDLQVFEIYSDAFTVRWKVPEKSAGELKGYHVKQRLYNVGEWSDFEEVPTALGTVVGGLLPRTRYEVQVAAFTSKGRGTYSSASVTTIEKPQLPTAPFNLKAYGIWGSNISLGWTPGNSGRAVILHYVIEYNNDTSYHISPQKPVWRLIRNLTKILENPANISGLKPSTTYRFRMRAYNRVGFSGYSNVSADITTSEGIPSEPPIKVWASSPKRQMLLIQWEPPKSNTWNSGSIKYQFVVRPKDLDWKIQTPTLELHDTQARQYTAQSLQKYTMYNVSMRLFNDKGHGPWSKPIFLMTSEDYPAGGPTNVQVKALDASSILVNWGPVPVAQRNGHILGYKVYYMFKDRPETELWKDFPGNTTMSGVVHQLVGFVDYQVSLMAYTRAGGRFKSSPITIKTLQGEPAKPYNLHFPFVSYDYISVVWEQPLRPNGHILVYEVRYKRNTKDAQWKVHKSERREAPRSARVYGLVYNSVYTFEVRARTSVGWGQPAVEKLQVTADRQIPESPVFLTIPRSNVRTESIVVKWRPRFDGKSPIRSYNLEYSKGFGSLWQAFLYSLPPTDKIPAAVTEIEVEKLEPGTEYQFRVRAINDVGASPWSESSKRHTTYSAEPPGAPTKVKVTKKTPTTIEFVWEPPVKSSVLREIRGYRIRWHEVGALGEPKETGVSAGRRRYELKNLKVFRPYDVSIGTFADQSGGKWTPVYQWRTGEARPTTAPQNIKVVLQGPSKIRVTWDQPEIDTIRGYLQGFKVESVRLDENRSRRRRRSVDETLLRKRRTIEAVCPLEAKVQTHLAGPYAHEVTLKNLRKYTKYALTVRVYNSYGDGPKSRVQHFTTPVDVPGPPYLLSERIYANLIDVDFATPCEANGEILGYRVEYREKSGVSLPTITYGEATRRIRITSLRTSTAYLMSLSARTSAGYGQKATIEFYTKDSISKPQAPGIPSVYRNEPALLMIQWQEGDSGNLPYDIFYLQYKLESGVWKDFKTITPKEVQYDGTAVVFSIIGLKPETAYRFRVKGVTSQGKSPFSGSSKPIIMVKAPLIDKPVYKEIWFIFVMIIVFLLLVIIIVCCIWRCKRRTKKKKAGRQTMSSFEMSLLQHQEHEKLVPSSKNTSLAPSQRSARAINTLHTSTNSIAKSINDEHKSQQESDTDSRLMSSRQQHRKDDDETGSIANHYGNNPYHKNWRDSMDKKTRKELQMGGFGRQQSTNARLGSSQEALDRTRILRPGRPDLTERKKMAMSEPNLADDDDIYEKPDRNRRPSQQPQPSQPRAQQRRPGKKPMSLDHARSQPDLNRTTRSPDNPVTRQPSFLRATLGGSHDIAEDEPRDNESFQEAFEREKTKQEMAMELDSRLDSQLDSSYPSNAPPPYDYHAAPPAYTPSQQDDDELLSDIGYPVKPLILPKPQRWSDRSNSTNYTPPAPPPKPSHYERVDKPRYSSSSDRPLLSGRASVEPRFSSEPRFSPEPHYSSASINSQDGFAPPQVSKFDDEILDDISDHDDDNNNTTLV